MLTEFIVTPDASSDIGHQENEVNGQKNSLKMVILDDPKCIQIGNYYSCFPDLYRYSETKTGRKSKILKTNNTPLPAYNYNHEVGPDQEIGLAVKFYNKSFADLFGGRFNSRFERLTYAIWVGDDAPHIHKFCHDGKDLSAGLVYRFHAYRDVIDNAILNNENNLIPAILFFGKSIQLIKDGVGASSWKLICKNSLSRNSAIFNTLYSSLKYRANKGVIPFSPTHLRKPKIARTRPDSFKVLIEKLLRLPSSILNSDFFRSKMKNKPQIEHLETLDIFYWISSEARKVKKLTNQEFVRNAWTLYRDTNRMAQELHARFSPTWSYKRLKREHNRLALEHLKLTHSDETYSFEFPWIEELQIDGVTVKLLSSAFALSQEGAEMHHCVASYHEYVYCGRSIIFALSDNQNERSTLELTYDGGRLQIAQHRSKYNEPASAKLMAVAHVVLEKQGKVILNQQQDKPVGIRTTAARNALPLFQ